MTIQDRAINLYEAMSQESIGINAQIKIWLAVFNTEELEELWQDCQADLSIAYDDEVYNALNAINYFNK